MTTICCHSMISPEDDIIVIHPILISVTVLNSITVRKTKKSLQNERIIAAYHRLYLLLNNIFNSRSNANRPAEVSIIYYYIYTYIYIYI